MNKEYSSEKFFFTFIFEGNEAIYAMHPNQLAKRIVDLWERERSRQLDLAGPSRQMSLPIQLFTGIDNVEWNMSSLMLNLMTGQLISAGPCMVRYSQRNLILWIITDLL
ncbi:MAG TPA: hypothetical protein PKC27_00370 [Methanomethylovorans sp.]|nr:hypothetical protein [Methanomethylovorans sp.]